MKLGVWKFFKIDPAHLNHHMVIVSDKKVSPFPIAFDDPPHA